MPRLLLVDDNPSIHRIAESLLAPTDVELVCVDSAAEALDRIGRGERFDVALVDTAMPGMDGWTLLGRLRGMDETARMPIALMAGVLDPVDPSKLAKAPIQGFLKKPIELRELGDRVKALLATPVPPPGPSPFSTVPATPARDLVARAEAVLPEFRPEPEPSLEPELPSVHPSEPPSGPQAGPMTDQDFPAVAELPEPELEDDLLVLTAEDLWPEEPASVALEPAFVPDFESAGELAPSPEPGPSAPALGDVHLELEELDLDSLQDLAGTPLPGAPAMESPSFAEPPTINLPDTLSIDEENLVTLSGLEELEGPAGTHAIPMPDLEAEMGMDAAFEPSVAQVAAAAGLLPVAASVEDLPAPPAAGGQTAAAPGQVLSVTEPVSSDQARAMAQALLADPAMMDALVKAVVARMGDQVLREIAWEVMPDLAGRLQR
ncbi:MAG: response regulator [Holophagaceae bacterium]|nr:response regulator [Holophagaceae bacterium]